MEFEVERKITIKLNYEEALDLRYMLHDYEDYDNKVTNTDESCKATFEKLINLLDYMD